MGVSRAAFGTRNIFRDASVSVLVALAAAFWMLALAVPARAWDSRTHRLITRLAIAAMPSSEFKTFLERNEKRLERYSVEPDSKLKKLYGEAEKRRHYIDADHYGPDPFSRLNPSLAATEARFGAANVERWGTLPWTIEEFADHLGGQMSNQASGGDDARGCETILRLAGYLSHYVGDSTQPLHATSHFDGFHQDRGVHRRIEAATDDEAGRLETMARPESETHAIDSVWNATIAELRHSHSLVMQLIEGDRAARAQSHGGVDSYDSAFMERDGPMIAGQIARGAALLASFWLYEWERAGRPAMCQTGVRPRRSRRHRMSVFTAPGAF